MMLPMEHFSLGHGHDEKSERLSLSRIGLGTWALGNKHWGTASLREAEETLEAAAELGINWVDTAPIYGESDARCGPLAERLGLHIATKVGVCDEPGGHAFSDLRPEHIVEDCEASLRRLGVECIDVLQVHWPCERGAALEDSLGALEGLRQQGKVRCFGLCNYNAAGIAAAARVVAPPVSVQLPYSWIRRDQEPAIQAAAQAGMAVLAYETLGRGLLTGKYRSLPTFDRGDVRKSDPRFWGQRFFAIQRRVEVLRREAERRHGSPAAVAIAWVLSRPGISGVIVGARRPDQLRENLGALRLLSRDPEGEKR